MSLWGPFSSKIPHLSKKSCALLLVLNQGNQTNDRFMGNVCIDKDIHATNNDPFAGEMFLEYNSKVGIFLYMVRVKNQRSVRDLRVLAHA